MNFTKALLANIDKLVGTLKPEEELEEVLKKKFTKKEFKVFTAIESGKTVEDLKESMKDDEERITELYKNACKKVNQEKIKKELISIK